LRRILSFLYPVDKLTAYNQGRRDEQMDVESLIEAFRLSRWLDIATCNIILDHLNHIDRRPKGKL
jgi:hypothetical protein